MVIDLVGYFCLGAGVSATIGSPIEWKIHKDLLHASPKSRKKVSFIENASRGHNDNHHGAYKAPEHYYRDLTNENEVLHFSKKDVGLIAGISAVFGSAIDGAYSLISQKTDFGVRDIAFVSGVVSGAMAYYGCYEFIHHYMHVIGERRLAINRVMGDVIQGGDRDGGLRISKPLLDDICTAVEADVDRNFKKAKPVYRVTEDKGLISRLHSQLDKNDANVNVSPSSGSEILHATAEEMLEQERTLRESMSTRKRARHRLNRSAQRLLRTSKVFRYLDNHHFLHHRYWMKNLNVVLPIADVALGSEVDCSREVLESERKYWLCPNSPDIEVFRTREICKVRTTMITRTSKT